MSYLYNGKLLINEEQENIHACNNMEEFHNHYAE